MGDGARAISPGEGASIARRSLSLGTKCASALLQLRDADGAPLIPWEHAQLMTVEQIISLFHFDHYPIRHEAGGTDHPSNLVPRLISEHRQKTAKIDAPEIAKIRSITRKEQEFRDRLLAKDRGVPKPKSKWGSRPMRGKPRC